MRHKAYLLIANAQQTLIANLVTKAKLFIRYVLIQAQVIV